MPRKIMVIVKKSGSLPVCAVLKCQSGSDRVKIWDTTARVPPRFVTNQGEEVGFGELGSAAVELASTLVALIT